MKNPLNEGQVKKINEISKLSTEEQRKVLPEFLKTLNEEQINFLKNQQQQTTEGECFFCSLVNEGVESHKIFEDEDFLAVLDIRPINEGHTLIIPKKHVQFSTELEDVGGIFNLANLVAKRIYEVFKQDTNIFLANGESAGQRIPHLVVHVIPRKKEDGIIFNFSGNTPSDKDKLEDVKKKLFFEHVMKSDNKSDVEEKVSEGKVYEIEERFA